MKRRTAQEAALDVVIGYSDAFRATREGEGEAPPAVLHTSLVMQAERAVECARKLRKPGLIVLNDPVGTGKTLLALCTASLLLDGALGAGSEVNRVLIVAPNSTVADLWFERAGLAGLGDRTARAGAQGAKRRAVVVATHADLRQQLVPVSRVPEKVLVIVDEAHRGLHHAGGRYENLEPYCRGARNMLVTATPFQLTPSGLERMIEIDGQKQRGDRIAQYGRAVATWLRARHELDDPVRGDATDQLVRKVEAARQRMAERLAAAAPDLKRLLMSTYPRKDMGMPDELELPPRTDVLIEDEAWARAYHVARVLPEVVAPASGESSRSARNSDTYVRMLDSSLEAWRESAVCVAARESDNPEVRVLYETLSARLGGEARAHPKVAATVALAVEAATRSRKPRHVLVFCVWRHTQEELKVALKAELEELGATDVIVWAPQHAVGHAENLQAFRRPAHMASNSPMILVARDNLSESIDLDGGSPIVIHHDLAWSPVRWTQRMGRVIRASTNFQGPSRSDVHVPVLATASDRRLWATLEARKELTAKAVPVDLEDLLAASLSDQGLDEEP